MFQENKSGMILDFIVIISAMFILIKTLVSESKKENERIVYLTNVIKSKDSIIVKQYEELIQCKTKENILKVQSILKTLKKK